MTAPATSTGDLAWVLAKLAARKAPSTPAAPKVPSVPKPKMPTAPSPLTEAEKQQKRQELRSKDMDLYWKWVKGGKKHEDYEDLLSQHKGLINKRINAFKGAEVNRTAMEVRAHELYRSAIETYDPHHPKKTALSSWVTTQLNQLKRFVLQHQNTARVMESPSKHIGAYHSAINELKLKLGYEPTAQQVAEHSGLSLKDVHELETQLRSSFDVEGGGEEVQGTTFHIPDTTRTVARVIYPTMKPHEQKVMDFMFPRDPKKKPVHETGQIAKHLGWHISKVSKAKGKIFDRMDEYRD